MRSTPLSPRESPSGTRRAGIGTTGSLLVLDAGQHPDAPLLTAVGLAVGAVTWTRDPAVADAELERGGLGRCLVVVRETPTEAVAAFLARASKVVRTEALLIGPTADGVRDLLRLGVRAVAAEPVDRRALIQGVPVSPAPPAYLAPVEPTRCEVRVLGRVTGLRPDRPEVAVELPVALPHGGEVVVVDGFARQFGVERITFRTATQVGPDPHGWVLSDPAEPEVTDRWLEVIGALPADADGVVVPWPGSFPASLWVAAPARWCSLSSGAFEVAAHVQARPGAIVEVVGTPPWIRTTAGVFGRVVRAEGTQTTRLRCDAIPVSEHPILGNASSSQGSTPASAPERRTRPVGRRVEPAVVVALTLGASLAAGLVWMALHPPPPPAPETPAPQAEVLQAVRQAFE